MGTTEEVSDKVFTIPNFLSFVRLCLVPAFLVLFFNGFDLVATVVFAIAAGTDWVDGQVARRTNSVSRLGQLLDPAVDRILMISGVVALLVFGRLPLWIVACILTRDLFVLIAGAYVLKRFKVRIPVVYLGKVATTFLFVGCIGLMMNWPLVPGPGLVDVAWLPGLNHDLASWGIWFVYVGFLLSVVVTIHYVFKGVKAVRASEAGSGTSMGGDA